MATAISLRDLTDEVMEIERVILGIYEDIAESGGEITPEQEARLEEANVELDELGISVEKKVDAIIHFIRDQEMWAKSLHQRKEEIERRIRVRENTAKRLKDYVLRCLQKTGKARIETIDCVVRRQKNGQPSVRLVSGELPGWATRIKPEERSLDAKAVLDWLREFEQLPKDVGTAEVEIDGMTLELHLGEHLRIA